MHSHNLAVFLVLSLLAACADPKCPPDYILDQGRCKRCPEGSEAHGDVCVSEGGLVVASAQGNDDQVDTSHGNANAGGDATPGASESEAGTTTPPPVMPQFGEGGASSVDAAISGAGTGGGGANGVVVPDAGSAPTVDPCQGIAGCTACASDAQCPEPGACLLKHCNTAKGICEPTLAPAQTACGTSKCDGAGKCVGCLTDSDCGDPGECKLRYCNPTSGVCEPKNAPSTTSCPTGHCDQGACVQCSTASECADKTCQTKSCLSGQCRYTNVPAGQKGGCTSGVCTATQQCRECAGDEQCTRLGGDCAVGQCVNNACQAMIKTGSCGPLKMCSSTGSCQDSCGNGVLDLQAGEQCDPTAGAWNKWTCDNKTCKSTGLSASASGQGSSYRHVCGSNTDCAPNEMCALQPAIAATGAPSPLCVPKCDGSQCPHVSDYTFRLPGQVTTCTSQNPCAVSCEGGCPPGLSCLAAGLCAGPFY